MKTTKSKKWEREFDLALDHGLNAYIVELAEIRLKEFPENGLVWLLYGNALADLARFTDAKTAYDKAARFLPKKKLYHPYAAIGNLYKRQGNYRKAVDWYKKASEIVPNEASFHIFWGVALVRLGMRSEAEKVLKRALECTAGHIDEALYNLGYLAVGEKNYGDALNYFEKAVEIDPKYILAKQGIRDVKKVLKLQQTSRIAVDAGLNPE